ncbi:hypothetical protein ACFCX4_34545 [Kitasatospora sp. NPDC056327]|uniref:hypothetical protein n=1 Tax=Kitasatospora sp. NPDC056327 TaxID=3345785 RepID=UPI0035DF25CF
MTEPTALAALVLTPGERARGARVDDVVLAVDWTGEEEPGRLAAFAAARVRAFGTEPTGVDTDAVRAAAEADPALARGDLPVRQLDHLAAVLAELGFALLLVDSGTDTYELLVAPADGDEPPAGLTHEDCPVRPWCSDSGTALISLTCPGCSSMPVWELPPGETLAGEGCDCGTPLFDAAGRALPGVALHD